MYTHTCPKCSTTYSDDDVEVYLCLVCIQERKEIAKTIDSKFNTVGQIPSSELTAFMASARVMKDQNGREMMFVKEKL